MYAKISLRFKKDAGRAPFWPSYIFRTNKAMNIYDCILDHTDNHDLAAEISGWTDLAGIGEQYETDELIAEIIDD